MNPLEQKKPTTDPRPNEALAEAARDVVEDAQNAPKSYIDESRVPSGGE